MSSLFLADEEETDSDLLDEESGRDAGTRLLMAVDRLRDLRQIIEDERKQNKKLKELNHSLGSDKIVSTVTQRVNFFLSFHFTLSF